MTDAAAPALPVIERFTGEVVGLLDPVAVWAHGSLGTDDFQPGRSDLDLITVLREPLSAQAQEQLTQLHERIHREEPDAQKLHCSYMATSQLADAAVVHFTWAHGQVYPRTVTAVTRCELHRFGRVFHWRLISKREALEELVGLGAPASVVEDIRARRYGPDAAAPAGASGASGGWRGRVWRIRRGALARAFVRDGIRRTLAETDAADTGRR